MLGFNNVCYVVDGFRLDIRREGREFLRIQNNNIKIKKVNTLKEQQIEQQEEIMVFVLEW